MNKKTLILPLLLGVLAAPASWGQTAEIMDRIVGTQMISVSQAAYLVFVASGKLAEDSTPDQAFTLFQEMQWIDTGGDPERALRVDEYAYLLVRSYGLSGGILSTLFPGPRYAYRDLLFRGILPGQTDPSDVLTGVQAMRILGKVMDSLPQGGRS